MLILEVKGSQAYGGIPRLVVYLSFLEQTMFLFIRYQVEWPWVAHSAGQSMNAPFQFSPPIHPWLSHYHYSLESLPHINCLFQTLELFSAFKETQVKTVLHTEMPKLPSAHLSQGNTIQLLLWYWPIFYSSNSFLALSGICFCSLPPKNLNWFEVLLQVNPYYIPLDNRRIDLCIQIKKSCWWSEWLLL